MSDANIDHKNENKLEYKEVCLEGKSDSLEEKEQCSGTKNEELENDLQPADISQLNTSISKVNDVDKVEAIVSPEEIVNSKNEEIETSKKWNTDFVKQTHNSSENQDAESSTPVQIKELLIQHEGLSRQSVDKSVEEITNSTSVLEEIKAEKELQLNLLSIQPKVQNIQLVEELYVSEEGKNKLPEENAVDSTIIQNPNAPNQEETPTVKIENDRNDLSFVNKNEEKVGNVTSEKILKSLNEREMPTSSNKKLYERLDQSPEFEYDLENKQKIIPPSGRINSDVSNDNKIIDEISKSSSPPLIKDCKNISKLPISEGSIFGRKEMKLQQTDFLEAEHSKSDKEIMPDTEVVSLYEEITSTSPAEKNNQPILDEQITGITSESTDSASESKNGKDVEDLLESDKIISDLLHRKESKNVNDKQFIVEDSNEQKMLAFESDDVEPDESQSLITKEHHESRSNGDSLEEKFPNEEDENKDTVFEKSISENTFFNTTQQETEELMMGKPSEDLISVTIEIPISEKNPDGLTIPPHMQLNYPPMTPTVESKNTVNKVKLVENNASKKKSEEDQIIANLGEVEEANKKMKVESGDFASKGEDKNLTNKQIQDLSINLENIVLIRNTSMTSEIKNVDRDSSNGSNTREKSISTQKEVDTNAKAKLYSVLKINGPEQDNKISNNKLMIEQTVTQAPAKITETSLQMDCDFNTESKILPVLKLPEVAININEIINNTISNLSQPNNEDSSKYLGAELTDQSSKKTQDVCIEPNNEHSSDPHDKEIEDINTKTKVPNENFISSIVAGDLKSKNIIYKGESKLERPELDKSYINESTDIAETSNVCFGKYVLSLESNIKQPQNYNYFVSTDEYQEHFSDEEGNSIDSELQNTPNSVKRGRIIDSSSSEEDFSVAKLIDEKQNKTDNASLEKLTDISCDVKFEDDFVGESGGIIQNVPIDISDENQQQFRRRSSLIIQEKVSVKEIKNSSLTERIKVMVDSFCKKIKTGELSMNLSLEYAGRDDSEEDTSSQNIRHFTNRKRVSNESNLPVKIRKSKKYKKNLKRERSKSIEEGADDKIKKRKISSKDQKLNFITDLQDKPLRSIKPRATQIHSKNVWYVDRAKINPSTNISSRRAICNLQRNTKKIRQLMFYNTKRNRRMEMKNLLKKRRVYN